MTICDDLRQSVLQAAIQGKLTKQLPEDGTAADLLASIKAKKEQLIKEKKIKKEKPMAPIPADEIPFDIPENWEWVRLGNYCEKVTDQVASGSFASLRANVPSLKTPDYAIMVKTADFANGFTRNLTYTTKKGYEFLENSNLFGGELILSNIGSIGKVFIVPKLKAKMTLAPNSVMLRLTNDDLCAYLYRFLISNQGLIELLEITSGTAMKKFNKTDLKTILIPVPPLAEQHRIVARVDELMTKIDELETVEKELVALKKAFPGDMKASLLQAAMQGKLTQQLPEDGSAADLLASIKAEKEQLIKEKKIKKEKPLAPISADEIPFDIPDNWEWVRLSYIGEIVGGGTPKTEVPSYWDGDIPWLTPADMKNVMSRYVKNGERFITEEGLANSSSRLMPKGTVLYSSRAPIGYIAISENDICTNQGFKSVVPYIHGLSEYLYYAIIQATPGIVKRASGTTFKEISGSEFGKTVIPLPPLAEQKRIVEKLDKLLPLCDALKEGA